MAEVHPVATEVDAEGSAEEGWPAQSDLLFRCPAHRSPDQDRLRIAILAGDDVEAVMHPVDEVDVGGSSDPEHRGVARGQSPVGVRGRVARAQIGLCLGDPHP